MDRNSNKYDLESRTLNFSKEIIVFCRKIKKGMVNMPLISQLVRSATSIGANYCEANGACSKNDFKNKIYICKKEAKETKYWLQLMENTNPENNEESLIFLKEIQELILIFSKIAQTIESKK